MVQRVPTPWHVWVVGLVTVLWSSGGAFDYVMTQTRNASYMSNFTPEQLEYFYSFPTWMVSAWAIGVWGGVVGGLLILMRSRWSVTVLIASLIATLIATVYTLFIAETRMPDIAGAFEMAFSAAIIIFSIVVVLYARAMVKRGVLT